MRRVISLWLPRLATDWARRRNPTRRTDLPLVTMVAAENRATVAAVDDLAAAAGIAPGMALADARALVPGLAAVPADPGDEARALARLADWCERYTPLVAVDGSDGLFLDVTGAAHLAGGEAVLLAELGRRIAGFGFTARAVAAPTPGAAWALARFAPQDGMSMPTEEAEAALTPLSVASLRLKPGMAEDLARLGLSRVGDLLRLERGKGRAPLAARFGAGVWQRLDQALGRLDEPISPRRAVPPHRAHLGLAEPIATPEDIARILRRLLARLAVRFAEEAVGARRLEFALWRVDGAVERIVVGTARPSRDAGHLFRLFQPRLDQIDPGFGIERAELWAAVETLAPLQVALPGGEAPVLDAGGLAELVDRLGNRLGDGAVWRLRPVASHAPERAAERTPPLGDPARTSWELPPRPVRLLARPEPIDVVARGPFPDDAPSLFRRHAHLHRVRAAEGPERLAPEWWRDGADRTTRDYWRVEDEDGRRFWLFRTAGTAGAWFLHGEFA